MPKKPKSEKRQNSQGNRIGSKVQLGPTPSGWKPPTCRPGTVTGRHKG